MDKSLPYLNIIMKRKAGMSIPYSLLPNEFSFTLYRDGDEVKWAEIETSVGEFQYVDEAINYFRNEYLTYPDEIRERVIFIKDSAGQYIATITAWWNYTQDRRNPSIHWLAVKPEYQGLGLSKPLVYKCLEVLLKTEGDNEVYLHTQTWSYKAIGLYLKTGFELLKTESFGTYLNDFDKAETILRDRLKDLF
ncbi:GNAT family N-acetyltransferase [Cohnella endophytica]|uniref:GNAT family N-acetyltransferase n=1 Tax=Cohnella endophytica TaxID=2419778 RepID=UPI0018F73FE7|nr:GNAT family N-acetyltransferase [Cohnella endophytica]